MSNSAPASGGSFDLQRLKWLDPASTAKFIRSELELSPSSDTEAVIADIVLVLDRIFDDISVLAQTPETTSRGAVGKLLSGVDLSGMSADLVRVRDELVGAYSRLRPVQTEFVERQLEDIWSMSDAESSLRLHIGSGGRRLPGWINIDAGGDDLALNVNWGLPFSDDSVDFIFAAHVLEHLRYTDQGPVFLKELLRVLRPGGVARLVVPDVERLMSAYVRKDRDFFHERQKYYPLSDEFLVDGVATLDYLLLFCGASPQSGNFNHKFGYDATSLQSLLRQAGFSVTRTSHFQGSAWAELHVDDYSFNAAAKGEGDQYFSLFIEAIK